MIIRNYIKYQNALTIAASEAQIECVEILIKAGADVYRIGYSELLRVAVEHDNVSCADLLIKEGANVNRGYHFNPLYYAVTTKANRCMDLLLRSGADINNVDHRGSTALIYVEDEDYCRLLLKHHSHINRTDRNGDNKLTGHIRNASPVNKDLCSLLFAAGETVPQTVARLFPHNGHIVVNAMDYLPQIKIYFYLNQLCRETIRKYLLELDPHTNLFDRIPRLGLPKPLTEYLLYYTSLDSS